MPFSRNLTRKKVYIDVKKEEKKGEKEREYN